jgi:RHS repeat-associated protein
MSFLPQTLLCHYRYDPLDRLVGHALPHKPAHQRFYCKSRLATEIQGALHHSIVQHDDLLLAQQQHEGDDRDTLLLSTDLPRSVLHTLKANHPPRPNAYTAYGHHSGESGLTSLLGFNGERPDPVTGHFLLGNGYRAFNPVLMRFNSPDSLSPFGKGGLNSYVYCLGDPINRSDSSGHMSFFSAGKEIIRQLRMMKSTGTIRMRTGRGTPYLVDIRPGLDEVQALKESFRYSQFKKLSSIRDDRSIIFRNELSDVRMRSEAATEITGTLPSEDPYLNFLESIRSDSPLQQYHDALSVEKLARMAYDNDPGVSQEQRQMAQSYIQKIKPLLPYNFKVFSDEASRIFQRNFRIRKSK